MYNPFNYSRRKSAEIKVGNLSLGGNNRILIQSMANTDTNDLEASSSQCLRIIDAGADLVRFTTQGIREAESLKLIRRIIREKAYTAPLVADVHFNSAVASVAAAYVEKVRINPGNYLGARHSKIYSDEEFNAEYEKINLRFSDFLNICRKNNTAVRIGVNHGSLSERILSRYGDTPTGMVASCMEFLKICRQQHFCNVVISMKSSNTLTMVYAVRLLVSEMEKWDMHFPLHLGVTEAGDGEDGRIKSAAGIGALLSDGIGDTIRVSLSEDPENEIPVAKLLIDHCSKRSGKPLPGGENFPVPFEYNRRKTLKTGNIGGGQVPVVLALQKSENTPLPDFFVTDEKIISAEGKAFALYEKNEAENRTIPATEMFFLKLTLSDLSEETIDFLKKHEKAIVLLSAASSNALGEQRAFFFELQKAKCATAVIICRKYTENDLPVLQVKAAADCGVLLIDGWGDGIFIENEGKITAEEITSLSFGILQAARVRTTRTEYISCPGCGRTLFNLQTVIARVKARTSHLKGLKIGIMGCIVNGPGEMADADYGYVGAGRDKISLYKNKICVEQNIPQSRAVEKLVELIKANGDWTENTDRD
jgi:(E)-4-hydroxy-3-methylbut-2-enyl-diphosphate synthase